VENISCQFYLDWMAGNAEVFKITSGNVITGFTAIGVGMINGHAGNNAICRKHVRNIQSFNHGPCVGGVDAVTVIETAANFRVSIFKGNKTVSVVG
jgi:hypothetical protein